MLIIFQLLVLCLLIWVYYNLITGHMSKAASAFAAGALVLSFNSIFQLVPGLDLEHLSQFVDFKTISLLVGMMLLMPFVEKSGFFHYIAIQVVRLSKGSLLGLFVITSVAVALSSAFLNNVSTVMVFVPVILAILDSIGKKPFPFLMMIVLSANLGGTATLIGDPPNMIIGFAANKSFSAFLVNVAPAVLLSLAVVLWMILRREKGFFQLDAEEKKALQSFRNQDPKSAIRDKKLMFQSLGVFAGAIIGFMLPPSWGVDPAIVSLIAGSILLIILKTNTPTMEEILKKMEWGTLFFFIGMFTLVFALQQLGFIDGIGKLFLALGEMGGASPVLANILLLLTMVWIPLFAAGIMGAVPIAMIMVPIVHSLLQRAAEASIAISPDIWWALVLGACYGGNLTLVAAAANIVVAGMVERMPTGRMTFPTFFRYSFPLVMASGIVASGYILLKYLL